MAGGEPVPPGIDVTKPNIARVYDAFLDGKDNFAADRDVVKLLPPGLVPLPEWRPDVPGQVKRNSTYYGFVAGLARKPA